MPRPRIIVAHSLAPSTSDQDQFVPLLNTIEDKASADAGYCSEANLQALAARDISGYIATGRAKHSSDVKTFLPDCLRWASLAPW